VFRPFQRAFFAASLLFELCELLGLLGLPSGRFALCLSLGGVFLLGFPFSSSFLCEVTFSAYSPSSISPAPGLIGVLLWVVTGAISLRLL
jgi:hypothetical protein